jgi:hypothetical protein
MQDISFVSSLIVFCVALAILYVAVRERDHSPPRASVIEPARVIVGQTLSEGRVDYHNVQNQQPVYAPLGGRPGRNSRSQHLRVENQELQFTNGDGQVFKFPAGHELHINGRVSQRYIVWMAREAHQGLVAG